MLVSTCCGYPANGNEDYGICGDCKDHCDFEDDEEEPNCQHCNGSGEGSMDGSICIICKGSGVHNEEELKKQTDGINWLRIAIIKAKQPSNESGSINEQGR